MRNGQVTLPVHLVRKREFGETMGGMPVPRLSRVIASVQVPVPADSSGITELRVHGVGGSPPDATLDDLSPEQVAGDGIAGFYRTSDHKAGSDDDADRHVEVYSWGGLTSRSQTRVLWLVLLPFLLGNLAGWMCSAATRRFAVAVRAAPRRLRPGCAGPDREHDAGHRDDQRGRQRLPGGAGRAVRAAVVAGAARLAFRRRAPRQAARRRDPAVPAAPAGAAVPGPALQPVRGDQAAVSRDGPRRPGRRSRRARCRAGWPTTTSGMGR